jgi:arabinogalactan oligomer/maltooligosaccharide transport system permease protein
LTATLPTVGNPLARHKMVTRSLKIIVLLVIDSVVALSLGSLFADGTWFLGSAVVLVVLGLNVVLLFDRLIPLRWLAPGMALLILLTLAPIIYTCFIAFTNYSDDHLLSKQQAVRALELDTYLPERAVRYKWKAYEAPDGALALWLNTSTGGQGAVARLVTDGGQDAAAVAGKGGASQLGDDGFPTAIDGYSRLTTAQTATRLAVISKKSFGSAENPIKVASLSIAAEYRQRYNYDPDTEMVTDQQTQVVYKAVQGTFTSDDGKQIAPSFRAVVGWANFADLFGNPDIRSVAISIFIWTIVYAFVVVAIQFVLGLVVALAIGDAVIPRSLAKVIRSLMLLPYVIPNFLTILVWAAMLNPNLGIVSTTVSNVLGINPNWVNDPMGAKLAVILVTVWLGTPYFVLIVSGALQAIPGELVEASHMDGAGAIARFRWVVLPLLMRMVGPLVVLGMAFNFNNFLVVFLLKTGGPPMADQSLPAGHTDLLISFTYKLAFSFGNGANYGLAAVITMMIFVILVPVVASQFRYYAVWREED